MKPKIEPETTIVVEQDDVLDRVLDSVRAPETAALPTLCTAVVSAIDEDSDALQLTIGSRALAATRDPSVHPAVLHGALKRGERVLVEQREGDHVVIGALRTRPTPGIDEADEYVIRAERVAIEASEEVSLSAVSASVVIRALGEVETFSERIISRAQGVHKIIGRMLRLN